MHGEFSASVRHGKNGPLTRFLHLISVFQGANIYRFLKSNPHEDLMRLSLMKNGWLLHGS
ncbi:hypothetical protein Dsin_032879 [Dipteronia sinensis]|uniref:Uncharacterized protein n=1 Tax=Dipteronia sinensis TaxID=43782 RepID=A0AAD9Z910_9ROSI|nr:hypothetical protein Dsin_032879 [Dipteronia sinensis]